MKLPNQLSEDQLTKLNQQVGPLLKDAIHGRKKWEDVRNSLESLKNQMNDEHKNILSRFQDLLGTIGMKIPHEIVNQIPEAAEKVSFKLLLSLAVNSLKLSEKRAIQQG